MKSITLLLIICILSKKSDDDMMENFTLLSVVIFIMFLITAGMIIVRKIEFVRALPAFGIITALLAGL